MPNWVTNYIQMEGDAKQIEKIKEEIKMDWGGLGTIDFNKLIPMSKDLEITAGSTTNRGLKAYKLFAELYQLGAKRTKEELLNIPQEREDAFLKHKPEITKEEWEVGKQAYHNILNYGYPTWYEWSLAKWGTKWNASGYTEGIDYNQSDKIWFQTAWSAPVPILEKLSERYPTIRFTHEWADEDLGVNCGRGEYYGGECVDMYFPQGNKEAIEFAARLWEYDMEEIGLRLNLTGTDYVNMEQHDYGLIKMCGKYALFTNARLEKEDVPQGLHLYHLRHADDSDQIATVEPTVKVNHAGSVLLKEELDFNGADHIAFTEETQPCFYCKEMTMGEYLHEYDNLEEPQEMGEMTQ